MFSSHISRPVGVAAGSTTTADVVLAVLVFLFPAIYEAGWRPVIRMLIVWTMVAVLIILIRIPLPVALPALPELPSLH